VETVWSNFQAQTQKKITNSLRKICTRDFCLALVSRKIIIQVRSTNYSILQKEAEKCISL
jgi:hypothetical protein